MSYHTVLSLVAICATALFSQINLTATTINTNATNTNFLSPNLTFRDANTASNTTVHFGDLSLSGGNSGNSWGEFACAKLTVRYNGAFITGGYNQFYGPLVISGDLTVGGTKNFIQPHPTDSTKAIKYICIESGEALTLARGTAKTTSGIATIDLPVHYSLVTSDEAPLTVLLTPKKVPVILYTKSESKTRIIIAMKDDDLRIFGDAEFSWQVTGVRDGYENQEVIVDIDEYGAMKNTAAISEKKERINKRVAKWAEKRQTASEKKR